MSTPIVAVDHRRSIESARGGRGGAGNIDFGNGHGGGHEYVDGGLYRTESPGANGLPYSVGRGGAGNMGKGAVLDLTAATTGTATGTGARSSADRQSTVSDRHDHYPEQSIRSAQEGNIGSGGRGGAGNIGEIEAQDRVVVPTSNPHASGHQNTSASQTHVPEPEPVGYETDPKLENRRQSSGMAHLGMADKLKFGMLGMFKKG